MRLRSVSRDCFEAYPLEIRDRSRLQLLYQKQLAGNYEYRSKNLRWISLNRFSSEYLPNYLYLQDAIAIDLKHSHVRLVWKELQVFITFHFLLK